MTIEEIMARIDALKKDLEDLGVDVNVYHGVDSTKAATVAVIRIILEDLEASS